MLSLWHLLAAVLSYYITLLYSLIVFVLTAAVMNFTVHTDPERSWNLKFKFSSPGRSRNQAYVLESHGKYIKWLPLFRPCTCFWSLRTLSWSTVRCTSARLTVYSLWWLGQVVQRTSCPDVPGTTCRSRLTEGFVCKKLVYNRSTISCLIWLHRAIDLVNV